MAVSGVVTFNQTRNDIVLAALVELGVHGLGRTASNEDISFGNDALNRMVKAWEATGIHIWAQTEGVLFPNNGSGIYTLSNDSSSSMAANYETAAITQMKTAAAISATTLTVLSTANFIAGDNIGIVQTDSTVFWTTISSVASSTSVVLTSGLTVGAAVGANVYDFTSKLNRPLRIWNMRKTTGIGTNMMEIPVRELSHDKFMQIPNKGATGQTNSFYYNPNVSSGTLYLWPTPGDSTIYFRFSYYRMLDDFVNATDNPDFPSEWLDCLVLNLAAGLAPMFGREEKAAQYIIPKASALLNSLLENDAEQKGVILEPNSEHELG